MQQGDCKKSGTAPLNAIIIMIIIIIVVVIQWREPNACDFIKKNLTLACIQTFADQFLSNLIIGTIKLYILILV